MQTVEVGAVLQTGNPLHRGTTGEQLALSVSSDAAAVAAPRG